jgi:hypothetical protein
MTTSWWNRLFKSKSRPAARRRPARVWLGVEPLDTRLVPAVFVALNNGQLLVTSDTSGNTVNAIAVDHSGSSTSVNGTPFDDASITAGIEIDLGTGTNTVDIHGTHESLTIVGHGGQDAVTVGQRGNLQDIQAPLSIGSTEPTIALTVDGHAEVQPQDVTLAPIQTGGPGIPRGAPFTITGLTPLRGEITFSEIALSTLTLDGGDGGNTFTVRDTFTTGALTPDGGFAGTTFINSGTGDDTVNVLGTTGVLSIDGVDGSDTVNVGLDGSLQGIKGVVTVQRALGVTTLNVDDHADQTPGVQATLGSSDASTGTITHLAPAAIKFSNVGVKAVNITGGSGGNTFTVADTFLGVTTTLNSAGSDKVNVQATTGSLQVNTGAGNDTVTVGSVANTLDGIQGAVTVNRQGRTDTLNINDQGSTTPHTYTQTATTLSRDGVATITFTAGENLHVNEGPVLGNPPPPVPTARGIVATLQRVGKQKVLQVVVRFADTGAVKAVFRSPFQNPPFQKIRVTTQSAKGDGIADTVVLSALRNGKQKSRLIPA